MAKGNENMAIGKRIFEKEQQGKERAEYGKYLIRNLAKGIEPEYGSMTETKSYQKRILL